MPAYGWYIAVAAGYLIGSIPFGLLIGLAHGVDIRASGSGNIGATNVGRVLGSRRWGLICFALDVAKGLVPVLGAGLWFGWIGQGVSDAAAAWRWLLIGAAAVVGHVFPVYLRFRGGKGVATSFGVVLGVWPYLTLPAVGALATWVLFAGALRYVGLASVVAAAVLPGYFVLAAVCVGWPLAHLWPIAAVAGLTAALVVARHGGNLARIVRGTEPRLGRPIARPMTRSCPENQ
jgi:glycerol-3-phosphate acyltransferase PlsY